MRSQVLVAALSLAGGGFSQPAFAERYLADPYMVLNLGAAFPPDQDIDGAFGDNTAPNFGSYGGELNFDPGFFGSLAIGSKRTGFGLELEGFYHALNLKTAEFNFANNTDEFFTGGGKIFGGFGNLVYAFDTNSPWRPRLGGGVGYARVTFDIDNAFEDSDGALAYQGFAGIGYALSDRTELQANVRYIGLSEVNFDDNDFDTGAQFDSIVATVGFLWSW